jgi:hypothetical protein
MLAAGLVLSGVMPAEGAPFYLTSTSAGVTTSTAGAVTFADFDLPVLVDSAYATITGGTLNLGSNPGAGGNWITAGPGVVAIDFTSFEQYFGLYWGSNDSSFNRVDLFSGATLLGSINGMGGPNSFFNITAGNSEAFFDRVELVSPLSYFEVDNLAVGEAPAAVPEPASLLMLGTGLAAVAARRRFRKRP